LPPGVCLVTFAARRGNFKKKVAARRGNSGLQKMVSFLLMDLSPSILRIEVAVNSKSAFCYSL
jgi:hypothetical protein